MTLARKTQLALLAIAVVVFVLLFIAPRTVKQEAKAAEADEHEHEAPASFDLFVKNAEASLNANGQRPQFEALLKKAEAEPNAHWLDSLVDFWDRNRRPDMGAYYTEKIALRGQSAANWLKAGDRFFYAVRFVKETNEIPALYSKAMHAYEEALKLEPKNTDAKIQLASCYVDGSPDPMKGIAMLREVEQVDSNNVKLQMTFAFFSIKSAQYDKAIRRFEKVLQIDPAYIEAYLHLADAYEQQGNTAKTIEMLKKYASLSQDMTAKLEVQKYIEQLEKNK